MSAPRPPAVSTRTIEGVTEVNIVSAFTVDGAGGNLAGVVLDADRFTADEKRAIAGAVGLSETAFVMRSDLATLKLEFFTPQRQIAHCGHATIATFGFLGATGRLAAGRHTKETIDGLREVWVDGNAAAMQQQAPRYGVVDEHAVMEALGAAPAELDPRFPPVRVDTGNGFVLVGLDGPAALAQLRPDQAGLAALSETHDLVGFYVFTTIGAGAFAATARMFAPRYGIPEESATGMAAGPLACLLHSRGMTGGEFVLEQGRFMAPPSPSRLEARLTLEAGAIQGVSVAGIATFQSARSIRWSATA